MKLNIFASTLLVLGLFVVFCTKSSAKTCRHHGCNNNHDVVRAWTPPAVDYEPQAVTYVHGRRYHPTPYCNQPVIIAKQCRTSPWYYVPDNHHEHSNHAHECEHEHEHSHQPEHNHEYVRNNCGHNHH